MDVTWLGRESILTMVSMVVSVTDFKMCSPLPTLYVLNIQISFKNLFTLLSHSAHLTPNFTNPEYFVFLLFEYLFQIKVLDWHQNTYKNGNVTRYIKKKKKNTLQHVKLGKLKSGIRKNWLYNELNEMQMYKCKQKNNLLVIRDFQQFQFFQYFVISMV